MDFPILNTQRCLLRKAVLEDASWMLQLFNDKDVVEYIDGIKWFNTNIAAVESFILSMDRNFKESKGILWCVDCDSRPVGIIMANDLEENPFLTFALLNDFRNCGIGTEIYNVVKRFISTKFDEPIVETQNPIVNRITKRKCENLFIGNQYIASLSELKVVLSGVNPKNIKDKVVIEDILALYRDNALVKWLYYLAQNGDEESLNIAESLNKLSKESGDRNLLYSISKIINNDSDALLNDNLNSLIRILPTAILKNSLSEYEINIFTPIYIESSDANWQIQVSFEILQSSHDIIDTELCGVHKNINLSKKDRALKFTFPIILKEAEEENVDIIMDGIVFHTLHFQKYPNKDLDNATCTKEGVKHLYAQEYKKSRLCFNRFKSSSDIFWLGIMEYIGASGEPNPRNALALFRQASDHNNDIWSYMADVFQAILFMKGEGTKGDVSRAIHLMSKYPDSNESITLFRDALLGNLKSDEYDSLFYSYNVSDTKHVPQIYAIQPRSSVSPKYLVSINKPFTIVISKELSASIKQTLSENDTLHAYIGVTTANKGDWQYVIKDDWISNNLNNTFRYDAQSMCYGLRIDNLNFRQSILPSETILKVNLILRNSDGTKQFPTDGSFYSIDCLIERSHIALCNLSPLLMKFSTFRTICQSLNISFEPIN